MSVATVSLEATLDLQNNKYSLSAYSDGEVYYRLTSSSDGFILACDTNITHNDNVLSRNGAFLCVRNNIQTAYGLHLIVGKKENINVTHLKLNIFGPCIYKNNMMKMLHSIFVNSTICIPEIIVVCTLDYRMISSLVCFWNGSRQIITIQPLFNGEQLSYYMLNAIIAEMQRHNLADTVVKFDVNTIINNDLINSKLWNDFNEFNRSILANKKRYWLDFNLLYKF